MLRSIQQTALGLVAFAAIGSALALGQAGEWQLPDQFPLPRASVGEPVSEADSAGPRTETWPSVYGSTPSDEPAGPSSHVSPPSYFDPSPPTEHQPRPIDDPNTHLALYEQDEEPPADSLDHRRLAPRSAKESVSASETDGVAKVPPLVGSLGLRFDSIYSTITALVFVLGVFFLFVWLLRRGGRKQSSLLPSEVVGVLGRVALAPKQFAELLRVGSKLVLVSLTPEGPKPITEVTDPAEVDRLLGLCQQYDPHSTTRAFEQVFRELSRDRAPEGFLGEETPLVAKLVEAGDDRKSQGGARG